MPVLNPVSERSNEEFERVAGAGPSGAVALCAIAVAVVIGVWLASATLRDATLRASHE